MHKVNKDWTADFFSEPVLATVRNLFPPQVTAAEVDFIAAKLAGASKVLDVPCGAGRHSIEIAARGFEVTGVDLSPDLVADAQAKAQERKLSTRFEVHDMRRLPWTSEFDGVYCFGNSFAYFDEKGNSEFLSAVHRALRPGGRFLLQTNLAAESVLATPLRKTWYPFGDITMLHDARYDPATGRMTTEYGFLRDGKIDKQTAHYRIYTCRESLGLSTETGFTVSNAWGGLTGEPFALGSPGLYVLCHKS